ncbi:MAG: 6-phosphogluconolactonase [Actinomycetota bacterium]|nr:6-phosphogluconolactonase [Actinomycetota bacterium]
MGPAGFSNFDLLTSDDPAAEVIRLISEVAAGGAASLFLTGGSQAELVYPRLFPSLVADPTLAGVGLYLGDERLVPLAHPDSNTAMLDSIEAAPKGPDEIVSPTRAFSARLATSAAAGTDPSRETLHEILGWWSAKLKAAPIPRIVHLGLGPDGHVASIFPHSDDLGLATPQCTVALDTTGLNRHLRVSVTMDYIDDAELVILSTTGAVKGKALKAALDDPPSYPAGRLRPKRLAVVIDREAQAALA